MTHFDPTDLLDLAPADGEERTFIASHIKRGFDNVFTLACGTTMLHCGPGRMWEIYDTLGDWPRGDMREQHPAVTVTATWNANDGWHVDKLVKA